MTEQEHYEALLGKIEREQEIFCHEVREHDQAGACGECASCKPYHILRAVVELHKPIGDGKFEPPYCQECLSFVEDASSPSHADWPCTTIQAIEEELA